MKRLLIAGLILAFGGAHAATAMLDEANGRVEAILGLEVNGTLYNASFDQGFGTHIFDGNAAGAEAAVDAINAVLNAGGHEAVDNTHPILVPIYYVYSDVATESGYSGCRFPYLPYCSSSAWGKLPFASGLGSNGVGTVRFVVAPTQVNIDVIPGSTENIVYPNKSGKIPVAVLSATNFDATQVDPATLHFGAGEAAVAGPAVISDVDGEYGLDTTVKFRTQNAGIFCDDTEISLTGATYTGEQIVGTDMIDATDCESGGCHP